jgi:1-phosphofructokinase family hexose kinase
MTQLGPVVTVTLNPAIDQTLEIPGFAAGRVNRALASRSDAGGKGVNVATFLADLGVGTVATGFLGSGNADIFEGHMRRARIEDRFLRLPGLTRVGIKIVNPESGQTTDINFPGLAPSADDMDGLLEIVEELAAPGRWVVLSGSVPAGAPTDAYRRILERVHKRGGRTALDSSGPPLREALGESPEMLKPNVEELGELLGRELGGLDEIRDAARAIVERGVRLVAVSMGEAGALFVERDAAWLARPPRIRPVSTVGAGDAMLGGMVYARLLGLAADETARLATAAGAHAVTRIGSGVDNYEDIESLQKQVSVERIP